MQINNEDIKYLIADINRNEILIGNKGKFRAVMRQESAILLLNMAGYNWSWSRMNAYKVKNIDGKKIWEWFDATS